MLRESLSAFINEKTKVNDQIMKMNFFKTEKYKDQILSFIYIVW